jgi:predicted DNA-binding protein (UPF0251 family)
MTITQINALADEQTTDYGQEQAAWLRAVMRREIRLEVAAARARLADAIAPSETHDPRIVDVDARDLAMGC